MHTSSSTHISLLSLSLCLSRISAYPHQNTQVSESDIQRAPAALCVAGDSHFLPASNVAIMMAQLGAILARRGPTPASSARGPSLRAMLTSIAAVELGAPRPGDGSGA